MEPSLCLISFINIFREHTFVESKYQLHDIKNILRRGQVVISRKLYLIFIEFYVADLTPIIYKEKDLVSLITF